MENKIQFMTLEKLHSDSKNKDYYKMTCILDRKSCDIFIDENTYKKLSLRNLEYLKDYTAVFKATNRFGSLSIELVDLK